MARTYISPQTTFDSGNLGPSATAIQVTENNNVVRSHGYRIELSNVTNELRWFPKTALGVDCPTPFIYMGRRTRVEEGVLQAVPT